jgi:hypothetical protein
MKSEELIQFIENHLHIELYEYQKQLLRSFCKDNPDMEENSQTK